MCSEDDVLKKTYTNNSDGEKFGPSGSAKTDWLSSDISFGGLSGWKTVYNISCSDETRHYNMLDLDGEYENHFNSVLYSRHYLLHGMAPSCFPLPRVQNGSSWETFHRSINLNRWDPTQVSVYYAFQGPFISTTVCSSVYHISIFHRKIELMHCFVFNSAA